MNSTDYQKLSARTLTPETTLAVLALGVAGEAGEVAEVVKKAMAHGGSLDALHEEMGDLLWYVAALCTHLGMDLGDVMEANIQKLERRYPDGFVLGGGIRDEEPQ